MSWWEDLSDDELKARLTNKGMPEPDADSWVLFRETVGGSEMIDRMIGEE